MGNALKLLMAFDSHMRLAKHGMFLVTGDTLSLYKGLRHVEMNNIEAVKGS